MLYTYETPSHATVLLAVRELYPQTTPNGGIEIVNIISELKKQRLNLVRDITSKDVHEMIDIRDFVENSQDFFGVDDEVLLNVLNTTDDVIHPGQIPQELFSGITAFFWIVVKEGKYLGCLAVKIPPGKMFNPGKFKMRFELEYATFQSMYDQIVAEARQKAGVQPEHEEGREFVNVNRIFGDSNSGQGNGSGIDQGEH
jgi:hypothetical protein